MAWDENVCANSPAPEFDIPEDEPRGGFPTKIVDELPEEGERGIVYLVPNGGTSPQKYDEYIWINGAYETLGGGGGGSVTIDSEISGTSTNPVQNRVIKGALDEKANTSDLATVATSGSYNDLSNKPTIPSTASDVGAIPAPSSPATGAFLVWNGSAWVAQTLSTWQGGSY